MAGFLTTEKTSALGSTAKLAVLALASAGVVAGWGCGAKPSNSRGGNEAMSETEPLRLEVGRPLPRDLTGGEKHSYLVHLEPGQSMRFLAEQKGIDLRLELYGPGGDAPLRSVDSPDGKVGPERVSQVASVAGDYRIDVLASDGARPGKYEATLEWLRTATPLDVQQFEAEKVYGDGEALRKKGDLEAARPLLEDALERWRALGDQSREALALYRLGQAAQAMKDPEGAILLFRQAAGVFRSSGDGVGEARNLNAIGIVLLRQSKYTEARESLVAALEGFEKAGNLFGQAHTLNNLALVLQYLGQLGPAIEAYQQASLLFGRMYDSKNRSVAQLNLGKLLYSRGRRQEARAALDTALLTAESGNHIVEKILALSNLGELASREGRLPEAKASLEQALSLLAGEDDEETRAMTLDSLSMVLLKSGDLDRAWQTSQTALTLYRKLGDTTSEGIVLSNLGRIEHARGHDQEALAQQQAAGAVFERVGFLEGVAFTQFGAARSKARLGDLESARRELEGCLKLVEGFRLDEPSLGSRAAFFATKQDYWDLYVDVLMRLHERDPRRGFEALAMEAAERRKARSLLDALRETRSTVESRLNPDLARQIGEVEGSLRHLEEKRRTLAATPDNEATLATLENQLRSNLSRLDTLRTRMSQLGSKVGGLAVARPMGMEDIQGSLADRDTLLLFYSLGEERSFLWSVSADAVVPYTLAGRGQIEAAASQLARVLPRASREAEAAEKRFARALSDLVLSPAAGRISKFNRLIVVADGALQVIPFAALPIPMAPGETQGLLVERHEVVNLPSLAVLAELRKGGSRRKPLQKTRVAVVADPVFQIDDPRIQGGDRPKVPTPLPLDLTRSIGDLDLNGLKRLPYTRQEGEAILTLSKELDPLGAFGFNATRELFTQGQLNDYDVIHVATHSLLDSENPDLSGIVLSLLDSSGNEKDGYLRLHEIYGLDLKARLVVLSACETGTGQQIRGEGVLSVTRGFLAAGVPQLVVSLWKVEDESTAELMSRFYHHLFVEGLTTGAALRRAQVSMLRDPKWSAPRHWAGFVFIGDYRRKPKDGTLEEDAGGIVVNKRANSDLPPPKVPKDRPARPTPGNPGGGL